MLRTLRPTLVIRNCSTRTLNVLGTIPILPKTQLDVFRSHPDLSEATVIDHIREPNGLLYILWKQGAVKILKMELVTFGNTTMSKDILQNPENIEAGQIEYEHGHLMVKPVTAPVTHDSGANHYQMVEAPLTNNDGVIYLPKAGRDDNGYLDKQDWRMFKGKVNGIRIWQYQDIAAPVTTSLTLSKFENGSEIPFNADLIVNGSAVVVDKNKPEKELSAVNNWFIRDEPVNLVVVDKHIGTQVLLNKAPYHTKECRVYYLVSLPEGVEVPSTYVAPPDLVRRKRIEFFDVMDIDFGGAKKVKGKREFLDDVIMGSQCLIQKSAPSAYALDVQGEIRADGVVLEKEPSSHYVLSSNSVGRGTWSPTPCVGSQPPQNPYKGLLWVKTPEVELYVFDEKRWVSTVSQTVVTGGANGPAHQNVYLRSDDNIPHNINSDVLPYDALLTEISASSGVKQDWTAEIHADGRLHKDAFLNVVNSDRAWHTLYDVEFFAGSKIQLYVSGSKISMPKIRAVFRKRFG